MIIKLVAIWSPSTSCVGCKRAMPRGTIAYSVQRIGLGASFFRCADCVQPFLEDEKALAMTEEPLRSERSAKRRLDDHAARARWLAGNSQPGDVP